MMRLARPARAGLLLAGALLAPTSAPAQAGPWALTNARIETVSRGVIDSGTIVIRNGLIAAVGRGIPIPPDARVLDLGGQTVTPGFLDLTSSAGLPTAAQAGQGGAGAARGGGFRPASNVIAPDRVVADEINLSTADARAARDAGVTALLVAPSRGLHRGVSALIPTHDSLETTQVLRSPVALHIGYQGVGGGEFPSSLLGVIAFQRQAFYDARHRAALLDRYAADPRGLERPAHDPALDALVPVVRGQLPAFIEARNENEIRRAIRLGREFNLPVTVVGAVEGFRAVDALAGQRAVVALNFPRASEVTGWSYRGSFRHAPGDSADADRAATRLIEGNAAALHRAGVRFALASGGTRGADYVANARKAIAAGLPRDVALAAMTLRAAEIAGMDRALGSIEAGKIANLVIADRHPLADSAEVKAVFVDGRRYEVTAAPRRAGAAGGPLAQLAGAWVLTLNSPQGVVDVTAEFQQSGGSLSGTMTSQFGTSPLTGQVSGRSATWSMSVNAGGQPIDITYTATVDGASMRGTAAMGTFGSFSFSGAKRP